VLLNLFQVVSAGKGKIVSSAGAAAPAGGASKGADAKKVEEEEPVIN